MERQPKETANDRNDRAIRVAAKWYKKHLEINQDDVEMNERVQVVLLTNDRDNAEKAREDGINTFTSKKLVTKDLTINSYSLINKILVLLCCAILINSHCIVPHNVRFMLLSEL